MDCCNCGGGQKNHHHKGGPRKKGHKYEVVATHNNEAAGPLAPGDSRYPQRQPSSEQQVSLAAEEGDAHRINPTDQDIITSSPNTPKTTVIMTGNGFFVASSGGAVAKSKSGTLPDSRYVPPPTRGFRDTFVSSMSTPSSSSPHHQANRNESGTPTKENANNNSAGSKKWTFGGLFKRKSKTPGGSTSGNNINSQSPTMHQRNSSPMSHSSPSPAAAASSGQNSGNAYISPPKPQTTHVFSPAHHHHHQQQIQHLAGSPNLMRGNKYVSTPTQTRHKGKLSESDITSDDSELEGDSWATQKIPQSQVQSQIHQQQTTPGGSFKQNFLTRKLSRRREKAAAKKAAESASSNGLLKVPKLNNGKRVGSSPESLNNGNNHPWPSWEITKKVPQLTAVNNYSSSGSLSLSQEGSGSTRGSRAAAKEAVKARAVARRESFIQDSSSEDEEERSIVGSHSSLTNKGGRRPLSNVILSGNNNGLPPQQLQGQPFRPVVDYNAMRSSPGTSPAKFDRRNNNPNTSSPISLQQQQHQLSSQKKIGAPGSPRWEARVVYTQENHENETPFVVRLPLGRRQQPPPPTNHTPTNYSMIPEYNNQNSDHQHDQVISVGLRVPIAAGDGQPVQQQITEEVHYANLPNNRFRSSTPLQNNFYNASPPPPPPRREYNRNVPNNQNFYRPVSCSYLDSYQGPSSSYYINNQNPHLMRNANNNSPNINGMSPVTSFTPPSNRSGYYEAQVQQSQSRNSPHTHNNGNYPGGDQYNANARHNNNFLSPAHNNYPIRHHGALIRSPSEPPEIKISQYARESSPVKRRNASTPTPTPAYYYANNNQELNEGRQQQQSVITSKLGFPVRKLQDAGKLPLAQSPVHMRASEFWRKKEAEISGGPLQANPNHKRYMNRIPVRSADSSPLPVHRVLRNSPAPAAIQNSNESISSLSSFSAEAQSPHNMMMLHGHHHNQHHPRQLQQRTASNNMQNPANNPNNKNNNNRIAKNPAEHFESEEKTTLSAFDRLNYKNSNRNPQMESTSNNKPRSLVELNNGKTPGRNLEDALNELEVMYKSLRLSDEDLLDRAERRDLPTVHQQLRDAPLIPLPQSHRFGGVASLGSVESLATGSSSNNSGSGGTNYSNASTDNPNRVRAPPLRRSAIPDTVQDDMAKRRCDSRETKPMDPRDVVSQTGSYMVLSPAFSPPVSPCPPETLPLSLAFGSHQDEPDLTLDDVSFRQYQKANSIRIIDPQPAFGIPLGPITAAPGSDYLHSKRSDRLRPLFKATKNPDLVNDDIAFRNLRKDLNSDNNNLSKDWTPRLFSPTRDNTFSYPIINGDGGGKKIRAIRSLSANITNYVPFTDYPFSVTEKSSEIGGRWNSFTDLHQRNSPTFARKQQQQNRFYRRPSWVEQVERFQSRSNERLGMNSNNKFLPPEPEHFPRKLPSKTVELTPDLYDPTKSRRPWTDIILESFEKEKQQEITQETAGANADVNSNGINDSSKTQTTTTHIEITTEDDDVFLDARDKSKSTSPEQRTKDNKMLTNYANFQASVNLSETQFPALLVGQANRRGSWVEPPTTSSYLSTSDYYNKEAEEDRRRRSWSDIPHHHDANKIFKPLPIPPLRKIKQINLDKFNSSKEGEGGKGDQQKVLNSPTLSTKGEDELIDCGYKHIELMDKLIRETADACGPSSTSNSNSKITSHVNVSSFSRKEEEGREKATTALGVTQKDNLDNLEDDVGISSSSSSRIRISSEAVPKIPQKESEIDEATKNSKDNNISALKPKSKRVDVFQKTSESLSSEIVSSGKHGTFDVDGTTSFIDNNGGRSCNNLPPNYPISPPITSTATTISVNDRANVRSIDELIDSINESLPELEAGSNAASNKSVGSSSLSSAAGSGSGSPPSSIPSPRPGSPTTLFLDDNNVRRDSKDEDDITLRSSLEKAGESFSRRSSTDDSTNTNRSTSKTSEMPSSSSMLPKKSEEKEAGGESPKKKKGATNEGCNKRRIKSHFPFLQSPCSSRSSRSRSQSTLGERESSSPSDFGEGKKEKDKSHKRKSHLNRAFTDEPVPPTEQPSSFHLPPSPKTKIKMGMRESSSGTKKGAPICKVPPIPSILTSTTTSNERGRGTNRKESSANGTSSVDNSISRSKQLPPSPTRTNTNILNKLQTFESPKNNKTIPSALVVNKRDSFSDAEGVSFIKKLLQKESMAEKTINEVKQSTTNASFILKKSSSAGSTNSKYWSKFTASQPILKKFFDKPEKSLDENKNNQQLLNNNEQENSKHLHGNATATTTTTDDDDDDGVVAQPEEEEKVISYSVAQKASFFMKLEHEQRFSKWRKNSLDASSSSPIPNSITTKINSVAADASNTNEMRSNNRQQIPMNVATAANLKSNNNETDSEIHNEQTNEQEDCHLSLKDRVHMFDKLIAVGGKTPSTPHGVTSAGFVPVTHSSSAVYTQGISQVSETNQQAKTGQQIGPLYQQRRAGSGTDLHQMLTTKNCYPLPTFKAQIASSNNAKRNQKTRSLYVNNDDLSEDGEVSSGGQEVAEIISRSYENSPVARKKYWKNQKQTQSTFTKEIWRKCKVNDNTFGPQTYKVTTTNVAHNTAVIKDKICDKSSIPSGIIDVNVNPNSNPETPPMTTSNLLQILSALSSSSNEEELEENGKTKSRSTFEQSQESSQGNISNLNSSSSEVVVVEGTHQVYIPQPDDESFQLFFGKASTSNTSISIPHNNNNNNNNDSRGEGGERFINLSNQSNDPEMNIVKRESDLLVMKKNVPLVRRKSSGKSRGNPLKALAARMDLHNQWYTEEDNNGEANNSDGDKESL